MRFMTKNKQPFYYALYSGKEELKDDAGNRTGEYAITYAKPKLAYANISPATGSAAVEIFGTSTPYSRVLGPMGVHCHIDENTVLYINTWPGLGQPDYIVKRTARSLNHVMYLIEEINHE